MLGADTRATEGPIVADKNCEKIHYIADNIYCCGAGTAADTQVTNRTPRSVYMSYVCRDLDIYGYISFRVDQLAIGAPSHEYRSSAARCDRVPDAQADALQVSFLFFFFPPSSLPLLLL